MSIQNTYIIAEAGLNHNGSLDIAKKLIDIASECDCDAVKFQKRDVENLAISSELNKEDLRFPDFGNTYKKIRNHLEFNFNEYSELKEYTKSKNLEFIVTAFDIQSYNFLEDLDVDAIKLASHVITNIPLLKEVSKTKKKIILSTGMCEIEDIKIAVNIFSKNNLSLLHCVSSYPTPEEDCNLKAINLLKSFNLPVGYSGHEIGFYPTLLAVATGAKIIERHYTIDKNMKGFDHKISLEPNDLFLMVKEIRKIEQILGNGKKIISSTEKITKNKYNVSAVLKEDIKINTILNENMLTFKNPGTGILFKNINKIIGKKANQDIKKDTLLSEEMFS